MDPLFSENHRHNLLGMNEETGAGGAQEEQGELR